MTTTLRGDRVVLLRGESSLRPRTRKMYVLRPTKYFTHPNLRPPKNFSHSSLRPTENFTYSSLRPRKGSPIKNWI